jgi:hypothetical protein
LIIPKSTLPPSGPDILEYGEKKITKLMIVSVMMIAHNHV